MKRIDLTGRTFGFLTVISLAENRNGVLIWECRCVCGNTKQVRGSNLKSGHVKSCRCEGMTVVGRFLAKTDKAGPNGCWIWIGAFAGEYGTFQIEGVQMPAHRASLVLLRDMELPGGHQDHVDHLCRNKKCVNPDHLELVRAGINIDRRDAALGRLTTEQIHQIRSVLETGFYTQAELARLFNVHPSTISHIKTGATKRSSQCV